MVYGRESKRALQGKGKKGKRKESRVVSGLQNTWDHAEERKKGVHKSPVDASNPANVGGHPALGNAPAKQNVSRLVTAGFLVFFSRISEGIWRCRLAAVVVTHTLQVASS